MINPILDIQEKQLEDNSIQSYEFYEHKENHVDVKKLTKFEFQTRNLDAWYHGSEGYIMVLWKIIKSDGNNIDKRVTACNNICNFFKSAELYLNNESIEKIEHIGIKTLIENLINYSDDYSRSAASNQFWFPDTADSTDIAKYKYVGTENKMENLENNKKYAEKLIENPNFNKGYHDRLRKTKESKSVCSIIPLSKLFGFFKSYHKIFRGLNIRVLLYLNDMNNIIHKEGNDGNYKVLIENMSMWIPELELADITKGVLETQIAADPHLRYSFEYTDVTILTNRTETINSHRVLTSNRKPFHIYVVFQKDSYSNNENKTNMIFQHMNLEELEVRMGSRRYPIEKFTYDFENNNYFRAYQSFLAAGYKTNNEDSGTIVNYTDYKNLFPIFHIDVSKHPDTLYDKAQEADIVINWRLNSVPTEPYTVYFMVVGEKDINVNLVLLKSVTI